MRTSSMRALDSAFGPCVAFLGSCLLALAACGTQCDGESEARAQQLLAAGQRCTDDSECAIEPIDAPCVAAFVCAVPINRNADLDELHEAAARASDEYRQCHNDCSVASCAKSESDPARCNGGRCEWAR